MSTSYGSTEPDNWDLLDDEIQAAIIEASEMLLTKRVEYQVFHRYQKGRTRFQGKWRTEHPEYFSREAEEEAADLILYLAMRRVRERETREFQ